MTPEFDLSAIDRGSITAPAGCGKTQLIADTLTLHSAQKPILVLTHTNSGVGALKSRLLRARVRSAAHRVSTIDSWAIRLISKFPLRSGHDVRILRLEKPSTDYIAVRDATWRLLRSGAVSDALAATYDRLIVDEYQDCSLTQHAMIDWAATVLPTCILGDPLQAIFDFKGSPTVDWEKNVLTQFPSIGTLKTPWRWRNAGADSLGQWLLRIRSTLLSGKQFDLREAPSEVTWVQLSADSTKAHFQRLEAARTKAVTSSGTVLVIGDSWSPIGQRLVASQIPEATTVEAVDLKDLTAFGRSFDPSAVGSYTELVNFAAEMMTNLGAAELLRRVDTLSRGTAKKEASTVEAAVLAFQASPSLIMAIKALEVFSSAPDVRVYRPEVLYVCLAAMRAAAHGQNSFYESVVLAREKNRHLERRTSRRSVGSTLLLKGLEAEVVVVLNPEAMDAKHLYVALTRGAKRVVVCSLDPVLKPKH
jgi:superfamily I DNA/RNA helicase